MQLKTGLMKEPSKIKLLKGKGLVKGSHLVIILISLAK